MKLEGPLKASGDVKNLEAKIAGAENKGLFKGRKTPLRQK